MLPCIVVALSFSPPLPPISSKQVLSSSSFESLIGDPKVVLDFFLGGDVTSWRLHLSLGVGGFVHICSQWDWRVGKKWCCSQTCWSSLFQEMFPTNKFRWNLSLLCNLAFFSSWRYRFLWSCYWWKHIKYRVPLPKHNV